jgi:hypothetical protein
LFARKIPARRLIAAAMLAGLAALPALAEDGDGGDGDRPKYPTTEFEEGATSASVTAGDITAGVRMVRRPEIDKDYDVPLLEVLVGGKPAIEVPGVVSGMDFPAAEASIAEIDPDNRHQEVYFTSYSGGAHCCSHVVVAEEAGDKWVSVVVGDFDGDGNYLDDLDGDGLAEISTVDNRFLYQFDCYACSAAPLVIYTVRGGRMEDVTRDKRFGAAHREWLKQMEENIDPGEKWKSPGFLAGWVAEKAVLGEGATAFKEVEAHWDRAADEGEEVCTTGGDIDACPQASRVVMKFPDRLKLFLEQNGYKL